MPTSGRGSSINARVAPTDAQHAWHKAIKTELPDDGNVDYLELVLSHYYLGDHDGVGLASVLRAINDRP